LIHLFARSETTRKASSRRNVLRNVYVKPTWNGSKYGGGRPSKNMARARRGGAGNEHRTCDESRKRNKHYVGEFHVHRVANDGAVRLFVSRVRNKLHVPHAKIVSAVGPLLEYGDRRSGTHKTGALIIITTSSITPVEERVTVRVPIVSSKRGRGTENSGRACGANDEERTIGT